jgi:hypothetical protein
MLSSTRTPPAAVLMSIALAFSTGSGCGGEASSPELRDEQSGLLRAAAWGEFRATRHQRSAVEVLNRARLVATIVLQDEQLPSVSLLPQADIDEWETRARNDPYREGAVRFKLGGRDVLARYRPATDRLTISAMDTRVIPVHPAHLDPGIGEAAAGRVALDCLRALEDLGVIGPREFSRTPTVTSNHPAYFEEQAWIENYSFMFNPNLDGLPLRSAEVVITVNAWSSVCQRITVGGQVALERLGDARVELDDKDIAADDVESRLLETPGVRRVHVAGDFGYYLPVGQASAILPPRFLAVYATESGTPEMPTLSRSSLVGLSVSDPREDLVDLLGPL